MRSRKSIPRPDVALGDRDHEPQVRLDELLLGLEAHGFDALQAAALGTVEGDAGVLGLFESSRSPRARLDLHGEVDLLGGGKQREPCRSP
jgi:hypothetical protein